MATILKKRSLVDSPLPKKINNDEDFLDFLSQTLNVKEGMEIMEKMVKPMAEEKAFNQFATVADAVVELVEGLLVKAEEETMEERDDDNVKADDDTLEIVESLSVESEEETMEEPDDDNVKVDDDTPKHKPEKEGSIRALDASSKRGAVLPSFFRRSRSKGVTTSFFRRSKSKAVTPSTILLPEAATLVDEEVATGAKKMVSYIVGELVAEATPEVEDRNDISEYSDDISDTSDTSSCSYTVAPVESNGRKWNFGTNKVVV